MVSVLCAGRIAAAAQSFSRGCHTTTRQRGTHRANARSRLAWSNNSLGKPVYGAIAVLWRNQPNGWEGHVGFHVVSALFVMPVLVLVLALAACSERARVELGSSEQPVQARVPAPPPRESEPAVPSSSPSTSSQPTPSLTPVSARPTDSLDEAMAGLLGALAQKDVERFLGYFSHSKRFRYIGTIEVKRRVMLVDYEDLARGLRARDVDQGWYSILFDGGPDDSLAQTVADPEARAWRRVGEYKFVPPEDEPDSTLFVIWRKERDRWVVDAIGYPGA